MKQSELKCPWGCDGDFEIYGPYNHRISHNCNVMEGPLMLTGWFKTKKAAMKNWNSWMKK